MWVLRAAWADEAGGFFDAARGLRRRCGALLKDALYQGYALDTVRGVSSTMLSEMFRVGGDLLRAAEHVARGLATKPEPREEMLLLFQASCIFDAESRSLMRAVARSRRETWTKAREDGVRRRVDALKKPAPVRLRPLRALDHPERASATKEAEGRAFAEDFLNRRRF